MSKICSKSLVFFLLSAILISCAPKKTDIIVLEVGNTKVTLSEYEHFFTRNTGLIDSARNSSIEERERFLDLLTNYKLKVIDAYTRGLNRDPELQEELRDYRSSVAATYLIEKEVVEPALKKIYERKKEEIRLKHILIALKPDAIPEDTLKAYNRAMEVIQRAQKGDDFDSLVIEYSQDPSSRIDKGDIYYFTVFQMNPAIEDAAFMMKKGEISKQPVRSPFGYHILKIVDRQPSRGLMKARHIMARFSVSPIDSADTTKALMRINEWLDSLRKGYSFAQVAEKFSEDAGSAASGGDLGWFERRSWIQPFDEAVFKLKPGEMSDIVKTNYGYHLILCDSVKPLPPFSELRDKLKQRYMQTRYNDDYRVYINGLKNKYKYFYSESLFNDFISYLDTTQAIEDSGWDSSVTDEIRKQALCKIAGREISLDTIISILNNKPEYRIVLLKKHELQPRVEKILETLLLDEHGKDLEKRYPEFANLMRDYEDGVVLFKAEQIEVWNKISVSDSALRAYFELNKEKFTYPARVNFSEIRVSSDTLAIMLYDSLLRGADFSKFAERYNEDPKLREVRGLRGMTSVTADEVSQRAATLEIGQISEPFELSNGDFCIVKLIAKEEPRQKTFEEAGAELSNDFQENESKRLEREWLERIKSQHPVKQYKERLGYAFTNPKN